jgi:hypothetical protein
MIARPVNRIAEEKGGGKSVREIDKKGSRLRGRVQCGTESLCFSTAIAALRGHTAEERYNLCETGPKKEIPVKKEPIGQSFNREKLLQNPANPKILLDNCVRQVFAVRSLGEQFRTRVGRHSGNPVQAVFSAILLATL